MSKLDTNDTTSKLILHYLTSSDYLTSLQGVYFNYILLL